jgi:hypothetical protein
MSVSFDTTFMYGLSNEALKTSEYMACNGRMVGEMCIAKNMKGSGCVLRCYDGLCLEELRNITETSKCPVTGLRFQLRTSRILSRSSPFDRDVWLFQLRPWMLEECGIIIQDLLDSEAFDCAVAAQLYSQGYSHCCLALHEWPNVECSGLTTTVAYHLTERGRGSTCRNVKSCAAL